MTSGLHEKAWPEIVSVFRALKMGDPRDFYDAIITAGFPLRRGEAGTLGELSPKPHPWLYAEAARVGLGIPFEACNSILGIEDSGEVLAPSAWLVFPPSGWRGATSLRAGRGRCATTIARPSRRCYRYLMNRVRRTPQNTCCPQTRIVLTCASA